MATIFCIYLCLQMCVRKWLAAVNLFVSDCIFVCKSLVTVYLFVSDCIFVCKSLVIVYLFVSHS